jgi:hypothetical protein
MVGANFEYDGRGVGAGLFSAMYLSAAQLSTVGTSQINAQTDVLRALTIAETLSAPLLITLILTFLLGVYQVIRDLRTLSSNFSDAEHGVGDPIVNLEPYFPEAKDWTDICKRSMTAFGPMPMDCACIMLRTFFRAEEISSLCPMCFTCSAEPLPHCVGGCRRETPSPRSLCSFA